MELKITIYRADTANKILIVVSTLFSVASQNVNPTKKYRHKYNKYKINSKLKHTHTYTYTHNTQIHHLPSNNINIIGNANLYITPVLCLLIYKYTTGCGKYAYCPPLVP